MYNLKKAAATAKNLQEVIVAVFEDLDLRFVLTNIMRNYEGSEPHKLGAALISCLYQLCKNFLNKMQEFETGNIPNMSWLTIKGGNCKLLMALSHTLKNDIHYGFVLTRIYKEGQKIKLKFSNGHEIQTDYLFHNKIFFAGEHTTILDALGTMEGAIESGERMARLMNSIMCRSL